MNAKTEIAHASKSCRRAMNMTQQELAEELNVSKQTVYKREKGVVSPPYYFFFRYLNRSNYSLDYLFSINLTPVNKTNDDYLLDLLRSQNGTYRAQIEADILNNQYPESKPNNNVIEKDDRLEYCEMKEKTEQLAMRWRQSTKASYSELKKFLEKAGVRITKRNLKAIKNNPSDNVMPQCLYYYISAFLSGNYEYEVCANIDSRSSVNIKTMSQDSFNHLMGHSITAWREYRNLSLGELADRIGVQKTTLWKWENTNCNPSFAYFRRLCETLNVSSEDIGFGRVPQKQNKREQILTERFRCLDKDTQMEILNSVDLGYYHQIRIEGQNAFLGVNDREMYDAARRNAAEIKYLIEKTNEKAKKPYKKIADFVKKTGFEGKISNRSISYMLDGREGYYPKRELYLIIKAYLTNDYSVFVFPPE